MSTHRVPGRNGPQSKSRIQQQAVDLLAAVARSEQEDSAPSTRSSPEGGATLQQQFGSTFAVTPGAGPRLPDQPTSKRSRGASMAGLEKPGFKEQTSSPSLGSSPAGNGYASHAEAASDGGEHGEEESESDSEDSSEGSSEESSVSSDSGVDEVEEPVAVEVPRTPEELAVDLKSRGGELFKVQNSHIPTFHRC